MELLISFVFVIILIEAITNIISKSDLFLPIHHFLFKSNYKFFKFCHTVIECPYCTSVWVSLFCVFIFYLYIVKALPSILAFFFIGIVLHRLSNLLHFLIDRLDVNHISLEELDIGDRKNDLKYTN